MFTPLKVIIDKKVKKDQAFRVVDIQKKCEECENIILKNLNIGDIKVLSIKNNIINISCKNKTTLNEFQLIKNNILNQIKNNIDKDIKNITF